MAIWRFDGNACDFVLVPSIAKEDTECGYLGRDIVYLVAEEDPDPCSIACCTLTSVAARPSGSCDESTFTVAGVEFRRSDYASFRCLHTPFEDGARPSSLTQMGEAPDRGGIP